MAIPQRIKNKKRRLERGAPKQGGVGEKGKEVLHKKKSEKKRKRTIKRQWKDNA